MIPIALMAFVPVEGPKHQQEGATVEVMPVVSVEP
jgi:hypothetical protein